VTLALSALILPEDLYPWLNLVSGLLVLGVGAALVRTRVSGPHIPHHHEHDHGHHHHHHHHDHGVGRKGLLAMGASAGLIPCPSALVVLLGAIAQHRIGLGLVLIVAFSCGLAATLTGLGLAVVHAGRGLARLRIPARVVTGLPAASAALVAIVGVILTIQSISMIR
jgi:nickel/cobalt exporter